MAEAPAYGTPITASPLHPFFPIPTASPTDCRAVGTGMLSRLESCRSWSLVALTVQVLYFAIRGTTTSSKPSVSKALQNLRRGFRIPLACRTVGESWNELMADKKRAEPGIVPLLRPDLPSASVLRPNTADFTLRYRRCRRMQNQAVLVDSHARLWINREG